MSEYDYDKAPTNPHHGGKMTPTDMVRRIEELCDENIAMQRRIKDLEDQVNWYRDRVVWGFYEEETPKFYQGKAGEHEICEPVNAEQVTNCFKALEIYERERIRFKHAKPEMSGEFFISGYHGPKDDNVMPQFIEVCPAYGAGWVMIYEDTGRTISYEGS